MHDNCIDTGHLLLSLLCEGRSLAAKVLAEHGVHYEDARRVLAEIKSEAEEAKERAKVQPLKPPLPQPPPFNLDAYAEDWTKSAAMGVFRRVSFWQKERIRFAIACRRKDRPNILLLGNYETALLLVQQFACDFLVNTPPLPEVLTGCQVQHRSLRLDWTKLQLEALVIQLLEEVRKVERKPLLFVGTVDDIVYWSDVMLAAVQQRTAPAIAIAEPMQWEDFKKQYPAAASTFTIIAVSEPDEGQTLEWLNAHKPVYADAYFVTIDNDALTAIVELAKRIFPDQPLLAAARNLLDEVCAYAWTKPIEPPEEIRRLRDEIERLNNEAERALASDHEKAVKLLSERRELRSRFERVLAERHNQLLLKPFQATVETVREFAQLMQ